MDCTQSAPSSPFLRYTVLAVADDSRARNVILLAAAIIVAPRLRELKDSPALRAAVADAVSVAKYIARVVDRALSSDRGST
jgi:hypothetical protein